MAHPPNDRVIFRHDLRWFEIQKFFFLFCNKYIFIWARASLQGECLLKLFGIEWCIQYFGKILRDYHLTTGFSTFARCCVRKFGSEHQLWLYFLNDLLPLLKNVKHSITVSEYYFTCQFHQFLNKIEFRRVLKDKGALWQS